MDKYSETINRLRDSSTKTSGKGEPDLPQLQMLCPEIEEATVVHYLKSFPRRQIRGTWKSYLGYQTVNPLIISYPPTFQGLVDDITEACKDGLKIKAVGSGHSYNDIAVTNDWLIGTDLLNRVLIIDTTVLNAGVSENLCEMEAGMKIFQAITALEKMNLGFPNLGSYTGQSIIGAISTSTHGSGVTLGPLPDMVRSIKMVGEGGVVYRIEPTASITDAAKYTAKYPDVKLIQDDDVFYSVLVSMGCMGVVYSLIIEAVPIYYLEETRTMSKWSLVKQDLVKGDVLKNNDHYEILINPYADDAGDYNCLVTIRNRYTGPGGVTRPQGSRNFWTALILALGAKTLQWYVDNHPNQTKQILNQALKALEDKSYIDVYYKILDLGASNIDGYATEIAFPSDQYLKAADTVIAVANKSLTSGQWETSPFSLRFVKCSNAYLSPQHSYSVPPTPNEFVCMIELPFVDKTTGGKELMQRYETALNQFGGRPHWGLEFQQLSGANDRMRKMYSKYDAWLKVFKQFNQKDTFCNKFTERLGFQIV